MNSISVSTHGGFVVRRAALAEKQVSEAALLGAMEAAQPNAENEELLAFGPSFGGEAIDEFMRRLKALGLEYVDDFFFISIDVPEWCALRAELSSE